MNIKELKASLPYLFEAEQTAFIWGHAGIGKSTVVKQYAQQKGYKFFPFYLGTQSDIGDILGLASFVKDANGSEIATTFATPIWLKDMITYCEENPESGAVIFLDEFNRARRDILNGMFSLALDKTFHMIKLPKNCYIIAAGNPPTDEYFVTDVDETALMARFTHIHLEPSFDEWLEYAQASKFEPTILSFLKAQPELLEEKKSTFQLPVKVDRRAYERLNRLFTVKTPSDLLDKLAAGIIGIERLVSYKQHLQRQVAPLSGEEVLSGKGLDKLALWADPTDIKTSLLSGTCDNVFEVVTKAEVIEGVDPRHENLVVFLETLPKDLSYPMMKRMLRAECKLFAAIYKQNDLHQRLVVLVEDAQGKKGA